ncbi:MAG: hypothetical protein H7833_10165 [Magnetococcus sp. DMHC-1]|nr:hypothetical protein [Magnetococcales bacterium]
MASTVKVENRRKIFIDRKEHDLVKLNLQKKENQWHIIDPPTWRVSIDVIPDGYKTLKKEHGFILPRNPKERAYTKIDDYRILSYLKENKQKKILARKFESGSMHQVFD